MRKLKSYILIIILCVVGYKMIRNFINTDYECISSITYSAGNASEWAYGNQRKEFDIDSACYVRIGESVYSEKEYNTGNGITVTYRFRVNGDCDIELAEGKAKRKDTKDENVIEYTRKIKAQDISDITEDVIVFRYTPNGEGSVSVDVKYGYRLGEEFDSQSTIYFVNQ